MQGDGARELARFSKEAVGVLRTTENEHGGGSGVRSRFAAVGRVFGRFSVLARRRASANEARGGRGGRRVLTGTEGVRDAPKI